jgi:tRNA A37 threonylcarbamoyladenosine dehydratase
MLQQFYRTSILLGEDKVEDLAQLHVIVAGVGGVGGQVVEALARAGIGKITIIDNDVIDITNINRQLIATLPDVGRPKVEVFWQRIAIINSECEVIAEQRFINEDNLAELIDSHVDYVIDCIDTVPSKIAMMRYCVNNNIKIVSSMGAGNRYDVRNVKLADISQTKMCGLARVIRTGLKKHGIAKGITVVYSDEEGSKPLAQGNGQRPINGTISYLPPLFGLMLAGFVLKQLIDKN